MEPSELRATHPENLFKGGGGCWSHSILCDAIEQLAIFGEFWEEDYQHSVIFVIQIRVTDT